MMTSDQQIEAARLREAGMGWETIARKVGTTPHHLRMALDPTFPERRTDQRKKDRRKAKETPILRASEVESPPVSREKAEYDPLRDGWPEWRSEVARLLGDPPLGRSALEMKTHQRPPQAREMASHVEAMR